MATEQILQRSLTGVVVFGVLLWAAYAKPFGSRRFVRHWALGTVCATFALLALGGIVTTFHVGMADPIWPTYPWHLMLISWQEPKAGFLIEHTHRLAGYIVGCCVIFLMVGLWRTEQRRWLRWLGAVALAGVSIQGLLGGFRVVLNEILGPNLALIHGSFAMLVFSLLASVALFTAPVWTEAEPWKTRPAYVQRMRRLALTTSVLIFVQIVMGGFLRHTYSTLGQRGHLLVAFAVVGATVWMAREVLGCEQRTRAATRAVLIFGGLVTFQIMLGVEAWMVKYFTQASPLGQALIRTSHVLLGALVLASSVVLTLIVHRQTALAEKPALAPVRHWEGAA